MATAAERREIANHVLNFFRGGEGYPPGSFVSDLLTALSHADLENKARLAAGYPDYVEFFRLAQEKPGGLEEVRQIATGALGAEYLVEEDPVYEVKVLRTELVRRIQTWTVDLRSDPAKFLADDLALFDDAVCEGSLDHEDHEPVDERDLTLEILSSRRVD